MQYLFVFTLACIWLAGCGQNNLAERNKTTGKEQQPHVGGACEGCEVINASPVPFNSLNEVDTLPDFNEPGPKLVISGTVYKADGTTPASDVVLYIYHTDQTGRYTNRKAEQGFAGRAGYIKGWVKTNNRGEYKFYTLKPAPYPNATIPAHIHPVIKEPGLNEYYLDEYRFDDDPLLTAEERRKEESRGGSGVIDLTLKDRILYGERNIYLGRNIPDYPKQIKRPGLN